MNWIGKWIWIKGESKPRNFYMYARKKFSCPSDYRSAKLAITADSRYILYVNGRRLGWGPARSWTFNRTYDTYDLDGYLTDEENVIGIIVQHYGVSTFQYILGRGGLLCQLDFEMSDGSVQSLGSDEDWRVIESPSFNRRVPRIIFQQAWVEGYDARKELNGWNAPNYDDSLWDIPEILGPLGIEPWTNISPRFIPMSSAEPVSPVEVVRVRAVRSPSYVLAFDLEPLLQPVQQISGERTGGFRAILATIIDSPVSTKAEFVLMARGRRGQRSRPMRLNGVNVEVEGGRASLKLNKGKNLLLVPVTDRLGQSANVLLSEQTLKFTAPLIGGFDWAVFVSKNERVYQGIWNSKDETQLETFKEYEKGIPDEYKIEHVNALTLHQEPREDEVKLENSYGLVSMGEEATKIYPIKDGDIEILLDFGRELFGFTDFEVEADEGVILDWYFFEYMDRIGEAIQYNRGLNNVFRYVTRRGLQSYRTIIKRGFRYGILTIRNLKSPIKIRRLSTILSTYPVVEKGSFQSSDHLLNNAYKVGAHGVRCNADDAFTDCPSREQAFWVGDARNEAMIHYLAFGDYLLPKYCWRLAGESLHRSLLVEGVVPAGSHQIWTAWSFLWAMACEEYYKFSGDKEGLELLYPFVAKQCKNVEHFMNKDGLFEILRDETNRYVRNILEWAPMDVDGQPIVTHLNALVIIAYQRAALMARELGLENEAKTYLMKADGVKEAINTHLWDEETQSYIDSIHEDGIRSEVRSIQTQAMVYLADAVPPERVGTVKHKMLNPPEGWITLGGGFGGFFVLEAFEKMGAYQKILDYIRDYWGYMLDRGATTFWETFHSRPGSYCHGWAGAPTYFLPTLQLGVKPLEPGFKKVIISPKMCDLRYAKGVVPTPEGGIEVSWERIKEQTVPYSQKFKMELKLPKGVSGKLEWPISTSVHRSLNVDAFPDQPIQITDEEGKRVIHVPENTTIRAESAYRG